ncbi:MAG TPA: hypothetical protein VFW53_06460 [Gallionella sp.]|nr:hypothetical protein [Gallionella sp.]
MTTPDDQRRDTGNAAPGGQERRVYPHLRVIFEHACRITAPFCDPEKGWGGTSHTMYARQTLREAFPDLTQQDIAILFSAVQRFHRETLGK